MSKVKVLIGLSCAGIVFLSIIGLLVHYQPEFMHGVHVNRESVERNCYLGAACYGVLLIICTLLLVMKRYKTKKEEHNGVIYKLPISDKLSKSSGFEDSVKSIELRKSLPTMTEEEAEQQDIRQIAHL
jgi:hypothetical protein